MIRGVSIGIEASQEGKKGQILREETCSRVMAYIEKK